MRREELDRWSDQINEAIASCDACWAEPFVLCKVHAAESDAWEDASIQKFNDEESQDESLLLLSEKGDIHHHIGTSRPENTRRTVTLFAQMRGEVEMLREQQAELRDALRDLLDLTNHANQKHPSVKTARAVLERLT